jgi:hypothetical protein
VTILSRSFWRASRRLRHCFKAMLRRRARSPVCIHCGCSLDLLEVVPFSHPCPGRFRNCSTTSSTISPLEPLYEHSDPSNTMEPIRPPPPYRRPHTLPPHLVSQITEAPNLPWIPDDTFLRQRPFRCDITTSNPFHWTLLATGETLNVRYQVLFNAGSSAFGVLIASGGPLKREVLLGKVRRGRSMILGCGWGRRRGLRLKSGR